MEKASFVKEGLVKLPPGFRFHPTDEELVVEYLKRKAFCCPLPASIIPEFDVCRADPWDLPGDLEKERYFFSTREAKYPNGNRSNRATCSGFWKATGIDKKIVASRGNQLVGMKKTLVFYRGKPPHGIRTDWIMHEYRLENVGTNNAQQERNSTQNNTMAPMENWVLCRIFLKKRGTNTKNGDDQHNDIVPGRPVYYDFIKGKTDLNVAPSSSSSDSSSGITEISSNESSDDQESSSSCNTSPNFRRKQ